MKFNLPRPLFTPPLYEIASKEVKRQKLKVLKATKKQIEELAQLSQVIARQGMPSHLVRKKLPGGLGHGIFLHPQAKPLLKGQIIGSYAGEIFFAPQNLPDDSAYAFELLSRIFFTKEEQRYFDSKQRYHPRRLYSMYVDALRKGNFTRFINHSEKPNVIADLFSVPANACGLEPSPVEVIYRVQKRVEPGEQLLVSYEGDGDSYWAALNITPVAITPQTFQLDASLKVVKV